MWIILDEIGLVLVSDKNGYVLRFKTAEEARIYAENNAIDAWHIIEVSLENS